MPLKIWIKNKSKNQFNVVLVGYKSILSKINFPILPSRKSLKIYCAVLSVSGSSPVFIQFLDNAMFSTVNSELLSNE